MSNRNVLAGRKGNDAGFQHEAYVANYFIGNGWKYHTSPNLDYANKTDGVTTCPNGEEFPIQASLNGKSVRATRQLEQRGITVVTEDNLPTTLGRLCLSCPLFEVCYDGQELAENPLTSLSGSVY